VTQLICRGGCAVGSFFVLAEQCKGRCVYVLFPVSCQLAWQLRADILDIETMRNNKSYDKKLLQQNLICFAWEPVPDHQPESQLVSWSSTGRLIGQNNHQCVYISSRWYAAKHGRAYASTSLSLTWKSESSTLSTWC